MPFLPTQNEIAKPDLVIEFISVEQMYFDAKHDLGMPYIVPFKNLFVKVTIRNSSKYKFKGTLFLARTNTSDEAKMNLFSVFYNLGDSIVLLSNESKLYEFNFSVDRELDEIKFKINEPPAFEKIQPEENYFNNIFSVRL